MSRYELVPDDPELLVSVGWDRVLETYFAQIYRTGLGRPPHDLLLVWVGTTVRQISSLAVLETYLAPYLTLAEDVRLHLRQDARTPLALDVRRRLLAFWQRQIPTQRRQWQGLLGTGGTS